MTATLGDWTAAPSALAEVLADAATVATALEYEIAWTRALAAEQLIEPSVAERIVAACHAVTTDGLAADAVHAGTLAIALVGRLRADLAGNKAALAALHRGSTSQDLSDTVAAVQRARAADMIVSDCERCEKALTRLATRTTALPTLGRTLLVDARPITFGLRAAQWLRGAALARARLQREAQAAAVIQFGGAVGTCAGLGGRGRAVAARVAAELGLSPAVAPWHAVRDGPAGFAAALGILIGAYGKVARDIALLGLGGLGEVREPAQAGRGGSSAMPGKRNPIGSQVAVSAALRAPGLVASVLVGMPQELERGLGGWQAEGPAIRELLLLAGGAVAALAAVIDGLEVDEDAIARNLARADVGSDAGEAEQLTHLLIQHAEPSV